MDTGAATAISWPPLDPLLAWQWHLAPGFGIGATAVWRHYTGAGIRLGVLDDTPADAIAAHADLATRISLAASRNFSNATAGSHGAAVAGLAAAAADGSGVVGVAPEARLALISLPFGTVGDLASYLSAFRAAATQDVINASWSFAAPFADHPARDGLAELEATIAAVRAAGRGGLGTVTVFSAGNARMEGDWTAFHALLADPAALVVGATSTLDLPSSFTTPGSNLLLAAPGEQLLTTDLPGAAGAAAGDYRTFSGTSAAAPLVSGAIALMLEAEPRLGDRDVQEILALAARPVAIIGGSAVSNAAGTWNGGGLGYHPLTGFGRLDAAAAVRLAETWLTPGDAPRSWSNASRAVALSDEPGPVVLAEGGPAAAVECRFLVQPGLVVNKVTLSLGVAAPDATGVALELVSPGGTVHRLSPAVAYDALPAEPGQIVWSVTAAGFWGEQAQGVWTLRAWDSRADGMPAVIEPLSLTVLGDPAGAATRLVLTDALAALVRADPTRAVLSGQGHEVLDAAAASLPLTLDQAAGTAWLGTTPIRFAAGQAPPDAFGGGGDDLLQGDGRANTLAGGWGNDVLAGEGGNDTLIGGFGDDWLKGGAGADLGILAGSRGDYRFATGHGVLLAIGPQGQDTIQGVEWLAFAADGNDRLPVGQLVSAPQTLALALVAGGSGAAGFVPMTRYAGPVEGLQWQHLASAEGEVVLGSAGRDFVNLLGGDDAVDGEAGNDVLDGGTGSNFLTGGAGRDQFFVDGRARAATWSTVTDLEPGETVTLWGWRPGSSRGTWAASDGAQGWQGLTFHADLDGDGAVETSLTWAGLHGVGAMAVLEFGDFVILG